jgi:hypothetical protein
VWFFLRLAAATVLGVVLGLASAYAALLSLRGQHVIKNGPWATSLTIGGTDADMYTRASVAISGLFALNKHETIYFNAEHDSAGEALDPACTYRLEGRDPDTRWWSVTLYADDNYLIPNPANRYSVSQSNVVRAPGGNFVIRLSPSPAAGTPEANWIPTSPDGFQVTLRLYNPGDTVKANPAAAPLPAILKEACS